MFSALRCANLLKSKTSPAVFALPLLGMLQILFYIRNKNRYCVMTHYQRLDDFSVTPYCRYCHYSLLTSRLSKNIAFLLCFQLD